MSVTLRDFRADDLPDLGIDASMTVECPRCGHTWTPTPAEIKTGTWRRCPACSPPRPP